MTIISDYNSLIAAALSNVHRNDTALTSQMDRLVQLAEAEIFRDMDLLQLETSATGTAASTIPIPAGAANIDRISVSMNTNDISLDYAVVGQRRSSVVGPSWGYFIENGVIKLNPVPDSPYAYTIYYIANLAPLSISNPTNWMILNAPDVYFYALNIQVAVWTKDQEEQAQNIPLYQRAMDSVIRQDRNRNYPLKGGLQIRPRNAR